MSPRNPTSHAAPEQLNTDIDITKLEGDRFGLVFQLHYPAPLLEHTLPDESAEPLPGSSQPKSMLEKKLTCLTSYHERMLPFTWSVICLVLDNLDTIHEHNILFNLPTGRERCSDIPISSLKHFSDKDMEQVNDWLSQLQWGVAFQCATLLYNLQLCARNLLILKPLIELLLRQDESPAYTVDVIRKLSSILRENEGQRRGRFLARQYLLKYFEEAKTAVDHRKAYLDIPLDNEIGSTKCYHVIITPSGYNLNTVSLDMSNRILRTYPYHHDHFLRVSFTDEQGLSLRFQNQNIEKKKYIKEYVGQIMKKGFRFIGRKFQYLHYSHSSLKELTFWFISPFKLKVRNRSREINADYIRTSIGLEFPGQLTRCPARFGARLSQAFTATNASIILERHEVLQIDDVERPVPLSDITEQQDDITKQKVYCFTDGVGCVSSEMGIAIHRALLLSKGKISDLTPDTSLPPVSSVYQVRIGGAKGIVTLNPTLDGRVLCLRPSMVKFEVPHLHLEIARSFNRPGRVRLNRPLVAILYGRGVPKRVFMDLQRDAVNHAQTAVKSIETAGNFLEMQSMGFSFDLPSTLQNLNKLFLEYANHPTLWSNAICIRQYFEHDFMKRCMNVALYHTLRSYKYKTQIPVPRSWKLVGTIDEYEVLESGQVFVLPSENSDSIEGKVMLYKSPVIHPGDIQFATAVSPKDLPPDCPLLKLTDCLVFSQKGDRPLPDQCSGSDLDGDVYDLIAFEKLYPKTPIAPMIYDATGGLGGKYLELDHDCNVDDMIDFVLDFILNDTIGLISVNFLRIAEESGLFHKNCKELAQLHSRAVDFSKTGIAVGRNEIPFPKRRAKPDYLKPEIEVDTAKTEYYPSKGILGHMYRDIQLQSAFNQEEEANATDISNSAFAFFQGITACLEHRLNLLPIPIPETVDPTTKNGITQLYNYFIDKMQELRNSYMPGLGRYKREELSEEEIILGTILAKTFNYRTREEDGRSLKEETNQLTQRIYKILRTGQPGFGDEHSYHAAASGRIHRAWSAWKFGLERLSQSQTRVFGTETFMFVVLSQLFTAIAEVKQKEGVCV
ncbi:hypothetical protein Clacol_010171 [Clathrus columnatus]|uniref:RNA-dependent RNA polymerase n=1 Tax=Clathrus columnatus TaxID=1419009 RepID=A0AAV5ASB2_9AGAM|nr:hypothetical protein Clacol_010171 [Clathrus columnatus]